MMRGRPARPRCSSVIPRSRRARLHAGVHNNVRREPSETLGNPRKPIGNPSGNPWGSLTLLVQKRALRVHRSTMPTNFLQTRIDYHLAMALRFTSCTGTTLVAQRNELARTKRGQAKVFAEGKGRSVLEEIGPVHTVGFEVRRGPRHVLRFQPLGEAVTGAFDVDTRRRWGSLVATR